MVNRGIINSGLCQKAYRFALKKHGEQKRKYTGEPYVNHCIEVAVALDWAGEDEDAVCAGFLHDTLEDTDTAFFELVDEFGVDVATLVSEVTDVAPPGPGMNRARRKQLERNHLRLASDKGKSLKLADLCSNTPSIMDRDAKFGAVYLQEKRLLLPFLRGGNPLLFAQARDIIKRYAPENPMQAQG